jgi:hypothetical protein
MNHPADVFTISLPDGFTISLPDGFTISYDPSIAKHDKF